MMISHRVLLASSLLAATACSTTIRRGEVPATGVTVPHTAAPHSDDVKNEGGARLESAAGVSGVSAATHLALAADTGFVT